MAANVSTDHTRHECSICLGIKDRTREDVMTKLGCGHTFHIVCLRKACEEMRQNKCALCRTQFSRLYAAEIWSRFQRIHTSQNNLVYLSNTGYIFFDMKNMDPTIFERIPHSPPLTADELAVIIEQQVRELHKYKALLKVLGQEKLISIAENSSVDSPSGTNETAVDTSSNIESFSEDESGVIIDDDDTSPTNSQSRSVSPIRERTIVLPSTSFIHPNLDSLHIIFNNSLYN